MWKLAKISTEQFIILESLCENTTQDGQKLRLIQQSGQSPLVLYRVIRNLKYEVVFAPNAFEILSDIEPELLKFSVIQIDQPNNIGKIDGFGFLFGDRTLFKSLVTKDQLGLFN